MGETPERIFRALISPLESRSCVNRLHIIAAEFLDTNAVGLSVSSWNSERRPIFIRADELTASGENTSHGARDTVRAGEEGAFTSLYRPEGEMQGYCVVKLR